MLSASTFLFVLAIGSALLALWVYVRFPSLATMSWGRVLLHLALAIVLLEALMPGAMTAAFGVGTSAGILLAIIGVALPALTYLFLSSLWLLRLAQGLLGGPLR